MIGEAFDDCFGRGFVIGVCEVTYNVRDFRFLFNQIRIVKAAIHKLHFGELGSDFGTLVAVSDKCCDLIFGVRCGDGIQCIIADVS